MNSYKKAYNSIDAENFSVVREVALFNTLIKNARTASEHIKSDNRLVSDFVKNAKIREKLYLKDKQIEFIDFHTNPKKNEVVDENQQLATIQAELEKFFIFKEQDFFDVNNTGNIALDKDGKKTRRKLTKLDFEHVDSEGNRYPSPRARFLIWKYNNLFDHLKEKKKLQSVARQQPKEKESKSLTLSSLKQSFDIFKKIVDSMDDLWSGIASHIFPRDVVSRVTPYLMGAVVGFIHMVEAINGGWIAFKKFSKISREETPPKTDEEATNKRASDIVAGITGTVASVIGTAGVALSFTAMALTSVVLASMLPVLMVGIIGVTLIRRGVRYHHAEMNYYNAKYEITEKTNNGKEVIIDKENRLNYEIQQLKDTINDTSDKDELRKLYYQYFTLDHELTRIKRLEEKYKDKEFTFWFNVAELGAALTVAIGVVVGTAASFGTLASALGGIGVAGGMGTKVLESANENYNLFNRLKSWFGYGENNSPTKEPAKNDDGSIKYSSVRITKCLRDGAEEAKKTVEVEKIRKGVEAEKAKKAVEDEFKAEKAKKAVEAGEARKTIPTFDRKPTKGLFAVPDRKKEYIKINDTQPSLHN